MYWVCHVFFLHFNGIIMVIIGRIDRIWIFQDGILIFYDALEVQVFKKLEIQEIQKAWTMSSNNKNDLASL